MRPTTRAGFVLIALTCLGPALASAQLGVSNDRVSLPSGPGSRDSLGENVTVNANMATMAYNVPILVPAGFPGATPSLELRYDSGSGSGPVGIGWSLSVPSIERITYRGLIAWMLGRKVIIAMCPVSAVRVLRRADRALSHAWGLRGTRCDRGVPPEPGGRVEVAARDADG